MAKSAIKPSVQPAASAKSRKFPRWLKVISIVIGVIVAFFVTAMVFLNAAAQDAVKTSNKFVAVVQSGDTAAAYKLISQSFKEITSRDDFDKLVNIASPKVQGETTIVGREARQNVGEPTMVKINYAVETNNGTRHITVFLEKVDREWQVNGVNFPEISLDYIEDYVRSQE
jgi:uncharacterized protein YpmB